MNPNDLKPNPLNEQIYGEESVDWDLVESIKKHGLLENLVIKQDGTIISGHRRWLAVLELHPKHIKNVACEIIGFPGGEEGQLLEEERLLESNRQRKKTDVQLANEGRLLEKIYAKQAEMRMKAGKKQDKFNEKETTDTPNIGGSDQENPVPTLAQGSNGRTRAKVANELGMGEESYRKLKKLREASESDDQVIAQIADRLLKDPMTKNRKYNLFLNFMKIYHECNNKNPKISEYATTMVSDIYGRFIKIEDAHQELSNYIKAIENKEKALKNEYPSDDYESDSKEYIEDESAINEKHNKPSDILRAKPVESNKPKVSPKYQALLDKVNDENVFIADFARHQLKCVDNGKLTTDDAFENVKGFIREQKQKEQARIEMMKVPEEPGEILEKESERPTSSSSKMERPKDQNNIDTPGENIPSTLEEKPEFETKKSNSSIHEQIKEAGIYCTNCVKNHKYNDGFEPTFEGKLGILIKVSMESAKNKHKWDMDDHLLLNEVLLELKSS